MTPQHTCVLGRLQTNICLEEFELSAKLSARLVCAIAINQSNCPVGQPVSTPVLRLRLPGARGGCSR